MRILALPGSAVGTGCTNYRLAYPLRQLERQYGVEVEFSPFVGIPEVREYDLFLLQRQEMEKVKAVVAAIHRHGKKVIFDIDDDALNVPMSNPNYMLWGRDWRKTAGMALATKRTIEEVGGTVPELLRGDPLEMAARAKQNLKQLLINIGAADALSVSTPWLYDVYARHNKKRFLLPNFAEPEAFEGLGPEPHEGIHLGWAGGPTHFDDLKMIAGVIAQTIETYPQTKLVLAGYPAVKEFLFGSIPEDRLIVHEFTRGEWRRNLTTFDIILAPSADNKFNRGKSAIRIYQGLLASRGQAAVVGSETTYGETVRRLGCGYVCKNTKGWLKGLRRLIEDEELRRAMGRTGYGRMMDSETYEVNAWRWWDAYTGVVNG